MGDIKNRGLKKNSQDETAFRHLRNKDIGCTYDGEYNQYMPHFYSREGNINYSMVGNYRGAEAFLIGGGPSFGKLNHRSLHKCFTMTMNNSIKTFRSDAWISVDDPARFLASCWLDPKIMKFTPYDGAEKNLWDSRVINGEQRWGPLGKKVGECPNIYYFKRNLKFNADRFLSECTFNWGNSKKFGGNRSVMLPALRTLFILGFRTVYLLGVDLNMKPDARYHFDDGRTKEGVGGNTSTYKRMNNDYFPKLRKVFEQNGLNVYNCNKESELTAFDYYPYDDAVARATFELGNTRKEKTEGMYRVFSEKFVNIHKDREKMGLPALK